MHQLFIERLEGPVSNCCNTGTRDIHRHLIKSLDFRLSLSNSHRNKLLNKASLPPGCWEKEKNERNLHRVSPINHQSRLPPKRDSKWEHNSPRDIPPNSLLGRRSLIKFLWAISWDCDKWRVNYRKEKFDTISTAPFRGIMISGASKTLNVLRCLNLLGNRKSDHRVGKLDEKSRSFGRLSSVIA